MNNIQLEPFQVFILLVLAIMAIRFMWQDVFEYLQRKEANKVMEKTLQQVVGKEIPNGRNNGRRKESSRD